MLEQFVRICLFFPLKSFEVWLSAIFNCIIDLLITLFMKASILFHLNYDENHAGPNNNLPLKRNSRVFLETSSSYNIWII